MTLFFYSFPCRLAMILTCHAFSFCRFKELSRALYSLTVLVVSHNEVSIMVPAGKVNDISGNLNLASNRLEVKHCASTISFPLFQIL